MFDPIRFISEKNSD